MAVPAPPTKHPEFYFDEPDTITFEVDGILFRPHTFVLRRYCGLFRDMLAIGSHILVEGATTPIKLADVHLADGDYKEISVEGFELALRVIYPEVLYVNPPRTPAQWIQVLEISRRWQSDHMRTVAITNLGSKSGLTPSARLSLASAHSIENWLPEIYRDLVLQCGPVSEDDLALMSRAHLTGFVIARERARARFLQTISSDRCPIKRCSKQARGLELLKQAVAALLHHSPASSVSVVDYFVNSIRASTVLCDKCRRNDWQSKWDQRPTVDRYLDRYCFSKSGGSE